MPEYLRLLAPPKALSQTALRCPMAVAILLRAPCRAPVTTEVLMSTHPVLPPARFTMAEYLTFERAATERHEYLDGLIYAMAGESENHGRICVNLTASLVPQLRGSDCEVFSKDTKVLCGPYRAHTREGLYAYPDLVVVCGGGSTMTRLAMCS